MNPAQNRAALRRAREIARELAAQGAQAVVLVGSWVRGDAHPESDVDIVAIGRGSHYRLERRGPFLVSISWGTLGQRRAEFRNPAATGAVVPSWRSAVILHDPRRLAASLQREAHRWTWDSIAKRCDKWVAEQLTGWTEEVHKLAANLDLGRPRTAAVQRFLLGVYLAKILAVHHRILYDTENQLWDLVASKMGERWSRAQGKALGTETSSFEESCRAALEMFALAAAEVRPLLNDRQREVVAHACRIAGFPW